MKAPINLPDVFANRHKKYHFRFDDNEEYKAWLKYYFIQHQILLPIDPDRCNYKQEAEMGDASFIYLVGMFYARGFRCEENYRRAMRWWKLAGEKGNKSSQYLLGSTYYFGHVVHKNYKKAACWLEKAALQDDDWAQVLLGDCYYLGRGVAKNYETAAYWYEKAAKLGNVDAQNMLGYLKQMNF
ncbi:MAG: sel1 repeat family protein [Bacteroidales bacterium]|nr:sel1 repeat family protein [Bacteroidales bacterium]